ncbi:MAG: nucleotidyltransferase domain-containing protein [Nitrospiraceae bacterium]|nr:MAG: nucleotidyltransferase domain-containing protein [Nitrospiraceae bacterium]
MFDKKTVVDKRLISSISRKIVKGFDPEKIILFGSSARGTQTKDSDIDLLIIMDSKQRPAKRSMEISKACRPKFISMDILVRTPEEIKERLQIGDYFIKEILNKGKVLYARKAG